jgi:hypothetical protein
LFLGDCYNTDSLVSLSQIWITELENEGGLAKYMQRAEMLNVTALILMTNLTFIERPVTNRQAIPLFTIGLVEGERLLQDIDDLGPTEATLDYDFEGRS